MDTLPALYLIFSLLNAFRRGIPQKDIWREFRRQGIALHPRLSFWLALCRQAHLLDGTDTPRVSRFAHQWLAMTPDAQTLHLLEAWQNAPKNHGERRFRKKLLWKLQYDQPLTNKDLRSINGLQALGLCQNAQLTAWGRLFIKGEGKCPTTPTPQAWQIEGDTLIAPFPSQMPMLWDLDTFLRPSAPGRYPITPPALLSAVNRGDRDDLIALLERGLCAPLPPVIRARILEQPSLYILEGVVISFSHPSDLQTARRNPGLRRCFEYILSPRHAFLSANDAPAVLRMLARRGVHVSSLQGSATSKPKRTHFSQPAASPQKALLKPTGTAIPVMQLLEKYIQLQQAVEILYRVPGCPPEKRRITPLLIEQRGEYTYVQAFCQSRRANRTFRLDRMEIPRTF